ncbi:MAG: hypothetical protein ABIN67_24920 [Ferruginibacter sp.]
MADNFYRMLFMALVYTTEFLLIYVYGYKSFPKLSLWLCAGTWVLMMALSYSNGAWMGLAITLGLVYLFILRKPNQTENFKKLYAENNIYSTGKYSQAALKILGDKSWLFAEGTVKKNVNETVNYGFWQGHLKSTVSSGQYTRTTVYTYYLAFVFPPGSVSNTFKKIVQDTADRSQDSFRRRVKYFFVVDTDRPNMVTTADDGSFIIQYLTLADAAHYSRRISWIKENFGKLYYQSTVLLAN